MPANSTAVILTHGAWADGSSWGQVILPLERQGLRVIAAPIPLTSLTDDAVALRRAIERTSGPVILVAHAYAGGVIAALNNERVKSLVYVAALAPDKGETVGDVFYRGKPHPKAPQLKPDADGLIWMPENGFKDAFAQNASPDTIAALGRHAAADCLAVHSGSLARAGVANEAVVVPGGGRRPHDQSADAAFHGRTHGREDAILPGRSHAARHRAGSSRGCHSGGGRRRDQLIACAAVQAPHAPA